uniref:Uncharacterized protein n=1 Tax=Panagrolaimus davidi TaxID=227884 RepID=A0A914PP89_9BILA
MSSINTEVACKLLDKLNDSDNDSSHSDDVSQYFLSDDFLNSSAEESESENSESDIICENRVQSNLDSFQKNIMGLFESRKKHVNDSASESKKPLNDHENVEREFPMNPFELNPDLAELCPIFAEICERLFEASKDNQKMLKYTFGNCCQTLTLSHHQIKMECLECLFTSIITMAGDEIPGLGIQAIIDANLGEILVNLYNTDTDAKVRAETKKLLAKLKTIVLVENLPVEIDDILAPSDNNDNSELFGGHDSVPENNTDYNEIFAFNDNVAVSKVVGDTDSLSENELLSCSSSDNKDLSDHNDESDLLRLL